VEPARTRLAAPSCRYAFHYPDFRRHSTRVGADLGAARTGLSVYELPPGQAISPYHYEDPEEEWLLVVSGTPTLRHPGGEDQLEPWDLVFFPSGPAGAHLVRNNSESPARVAMLSSMSTAGAVVYLDSDMIWTWTEDGAVDIVVNEAALWTKQRRGRPGKPKPTPRRKRAPWPGVARSDGRRRCGA
jgi:uncharacterized cupin superfamily protein